MTRQRKVACSSFNSTAAKRNHGNSLHCASPPNRDSTLELANSNDHTNPDERFARISQFCRNSRDGRDAPAGDGVGTTGYVEVPASRRVRESTGTPSGAKHSHHDSVPQGRQRLAGGDNHRDSVPQGPQRRHRDSVPQGRQRLAGGDNHRTEAPKQTKAPEGR